LKSREYEDFVRKICEELGAPSGVTIHRESSFTGRISNRKIIMDVSFEAQILGAYVLGLVECKCYKDRVEVSDVEEFYSKLDDIGAHKGIMFTTVGYEAGAIKVAEGRGIALFVLRGEQGPGEIRVIRKGLGRSATSVFLRGNFRPNGARDDGPDYSGHRVESVDELFYILAFSDVEKFEQIRRATKSDRRSFG